MSLMTYKDLWSEITAPFHFHRLYSPAFGSFNYWKIPKDLESRFKTIHPSTFSHRSESKLFLLILIFLR